MLDWLIVDWTILRCVPTSFQARQLILDAGLSLSDLERESQVNMFIAVVIPEDWTACRLHFWLRYLVKIGLMSSFFFKYNLKCHRFNQGRIQGGYGDKPPPLDQWNLFISGGFQATTGAEPPLNKFLNTPLDSIWHNYGQIIIYKDWVREVTFS